ncbi:hypothetical protein AC1031_021382 [Aphanomyces cochlioides]|nr:hypothetical protein AC1031_021382 [Aphanomyces cochlioides]
MECQIGTGHSCSFGPCDILPAYQLAKTYEDVPPHESPSQGTDGALDDRKKDLRAELASYWLIKDDYGQ